MIIPNVSNECYHSAAYPQVNHGLLRQIERSPLHCGYRSEKKSDSLRFGSAFHLAMSDVAEFQRIYKVYPKPKRCCSGQAEEQSAIGPWIWDSEETVLVAMLESVQAHPIAKVYANTPGRSELTVIWQDCGVSCKCRPDKLVDGTIVDWKTTEDASAQAFERSVKRYGYDTQAAWYLRGCKAAGLDVDRFVFVAVESDPPYGVACYDLSELTLDHADKRNERNLKIYAECQRQNSWPGYPGVVHTLEVYSFDGGDGLGITLDGERL